MSEDPQDPKNVKPSGDSARGAEPSQPADPVLPGNFAQEEDDLSPKRFTGTLRGDYVPPEETSQGATLPPVEPASGLPSAEPVQPAAVPLFAPDEDISDLLAERESGEGFGEQPEGVTGSLRSTGPIRDSGYLRGTRQLSEDELRGAESAEQARGAETTPGTPAGEDEVLPREEPGPAAKGTGSLFERLTGSLRRATGMLRGSETGAPYGTRPLSPEELGDEAGSRPKARRDDDLLPRDDTSMDSPAGAEEEPRPPKAGTGSLLERLTGSLRRSDAARDLRDTGSLRGVTEPLHETDLRQDTGSLRRSDLPEDSGAAPQRRMDLTEETYSPLRGETLRSAEPLQRDDLFSMRDELRDELLREQDASLNAEPPSSGPALRAELPQDFSDAGSSSVRGTGPMRDSGHLRGTRPLSEDELQELPPAPSGSRASEGAEASLDAKAPSGVEPAAAPETGQPVVSGGEPPRGEPAERNPERPGSTTGEGRVQFSEEEPDLSKAGGTGSLLERLTGTLRKTTGELLGTGSLRRTGPLREPGAKEGEGGAKQHRPVMDESLTELRQTLTSEAMEQPKRGRGTGRLFERITGSLRKVTGSLRKTDKLRGQTAAEDVAAQLGAAAQGEAGSSAEMTQPEIGDDMLAGRLAGAEATAPRESVPGLPSDWSESPWFTGTPEVGSALEEEEAPGAPLFTDEPEADWEISSRTAPVWPDEAASETEYTAPEMPDLSEPMLSGDEPISLLDSGAIAALGQAEEEERQSGTPDWVAEIRHEVAEEEEASTAEAEEKPRRKGMTGQLRSFISGILRGGEEKEKAAGEAEQAAEAAGEAAEKTPEMMSDTEWQAYIAAAAAGQLGLAEDEELFGEEEQPEGEAGLSGKMPLDGEMLAEGEAPAEGEQPPLEELPAASQMDEDAFAARFGVFGEAETPTVPAEPPAETFNPYALSPEEEALLWGSADTLDTSEPGQVILPSPEELWEEPQVEEALEPEDELPAPDLRQQDDIDALTLNRSEPRSTESRSTEPRSTGRTTSSLFGDVTDEDYAAAYLAGDDLKAAPPVVSQDNLLRQALGRTPAEEEEAASLEDLRSIALEDYEEAAESSVVETEVQAYQVPVEPEPVAVTPAEEEALGLNEPIPVKQSWWAARSLAEKVLIIEAAVVALVLLIAIPVYTLLVINRVQARQSASAGQVSPISLIRPTPLPAELPHPTGIVLPGGWYFTLSNSTFVKGEWKPVSSEWKEDTELRRAVALPWNPQTDAVIRTFKPGDKVKVDLSNDKSQVYKIEEVKRVPITDTTVLASNKPSLVIILYNEDAAERWVVLCKP